MKNRYRCEMDRLTPRQEKLDELYEMIEGGTEMKRTRRITGRAAAILVCAVLAVTAAAAAAVPKVWDALWEQLGAFAPYAQTIDGAVCRDQGIEVQVLSALSDDLEARFYLAVRDVTGDRLNEHLTLKGQIENGRKKETGDSSAWFSFFSMRNSSFDLLSYDPETRTALFSTCIDYWNNKEPTPDARLSLAGMTTKNAEISGTVPCASVTGETLESLPAGEDDQMIFKASDYKDFPYTDAVLPASQVVLAPGQTPMPIEGNEDIRISSMGFASDGCFRPGRGGGQLVLVYAFPDRKDLRGGRRHVGAPCAGGRGHSLPAVQGGGPGAAPKRPGGILRGLHPAGPGYRGHLER